MAVSSYAISDNDWTAINAGAANVLVQVRSGGAVLIQMAGAAPAAGDDVGIILSNDFEPKIGLTVPLGETIYAKSMGGTYQRVDTLWS